MTDRAASVVLGHAPGYLSKVFCGRLPLRLATVFGLLRLLGKEPLFFFGRLFPLSEVESRQVLSSGLDLGAAITRLVALADAQADDRSPSEWVELTRETLRLTLRGGGFKARAMSRALDLKPDALGNALRRRATLTAFHLFGTLEVLGRSPGAFFAEICRPEGEEMPWMEVVELAERVAREAREKAAGQEPAAPGASPSSPPATAGQANESS